MMSKKLKTIEFTAEGLAQDNPIRSSSLTTAKKQIPKWWKNLNAYFFSDDKPIKYPTIKHCIPFMDAMSAGYTILLQSDVFIKTTDDEVFVEWRDKHTEPVTWHKQEHFKGIPIPTNYVYWVGKFTNELTLKTPKGYSIFFMHPSNQYDLPFRTFTGLVDTDFYNLPVHFPFIVLKNFEGYIKKGTPIVQIIPIKREKWEIKRVSFNPNRSFVFARHFFQSGYHSYKKNTWQRKNYDIETQELLSGDQTNHSSSES